MTTYCPAKHFDLVTCTGDAVNHIPELADVAKIFRNVYAYLTPGGFFVFGILIAVAGKLSEEGHAPETLGCAACPMAASCAKAQNGGCNNETEANA